MRPPFEPRIKWLLHDWLVQMAQQKNPKQTGRKAASDAARILRDPDATPAEKEVAASDLAQAAPRGKKKK